MKIVNGYVIEPCSRLAGANLSGTNLSRAKLRGADLRGANLSGAILDCADLREADLSGADLTGADLSGAKLSGVNLSNASGIGTKEHEIRFAKNLLENLKYGVCKLDMKNWHTCETTHCIAGWAFPHAEYPGQRASLAYPTLAKYFYESESKALEALQRVANGDESVL